MEETYKCEECGKTVKVTDGSIPNCHGKLMKKLPLDICTEPASAEFSRPMGSEDACDDGRAG
jgi:hypothetical protein